MNGSNQVCKTQNTWQFISYNLDGIFRFLDFFSVSFVAPVITKTPSSLPFMLNKGGDPYKSRGERGKAFAPGDSISASGDAK